MASTLQILTNKDNVWIHLSRSSPYTNTRLEDLRAYEIWVTNAGNLHFWCVRRKRERRYDKRTRVLLLVLRETHHWTAHLLDFVLNSCVALLCIAAKLLTVLIRNRMRKGVHGRVSQTTNMHPCFTVCRRGTKRRNSHVTRDRNGALRDGDAIAHLLV